MNEGAILLCQPRGWGAGRSGERLSGGQWSLVDVTVGNELLLAGDLAWVPFPLLMAELQAQPPSWSRDLSPRHKAACTVLFSLLMLKGTEKWLLCILTSCGATDMCSLGPPIKYNSLPEEITAAVLAEQHNSHKGRSISCLLFFCLPAKQPKQSIPPPESGSRNK